MQDDTAYSPGPAHGGRVLTPQEFDQYRRMMEEQQNIQPEPQEQDQPQAQDPGPIWTPEANGDGGHTQAPQLALSPELVQAGRTVIMVAGGVALGAVIYAAVQQARTNTTGVASTDTSE